ncbi:MAG: polysaccharide deacetylase family protein [Akkermansiaceae bacterium]
MNPIIRNIARAGLATCSMVGITSFARRKQSGACILMYHGLSKDNHSGLENHSRLHLDIEGFRKSAAVFRKHYHVMSLQDLADCISAGEDIPQNALVLTFDDGYASNLHLGLPVLEEYKLHATVFVSTGFIEGEIFQWPDRIEYAIDKTAEKTLKLGFDGLPVELNLGSDSAKSRALIQLDEMLKRIPQEQHLGSISHIEERAGASLLNEPNPAEIYRPLSWQQVRELNASDHASIGAHTHSHPILGRCTPEFARRDMERCMDLLNSKAGIQNPTFAYPNGKIGDFNTSTEQLLLELGIKVAVTTEMEFNSSDTNIMRLGRMGTPHNGFQADTICSGMIPFIENFVAGVMPDSTPTPEKAYAKSK